MLHSYIYTWCPITSLEGSRDQVDALSQMSY